MADIEKMDKMVGRPTQYGRSKCPQNNEKKETSPKWGGGETSKDRAVRNMEYVSLYVHCMRTQLSLENILPKLILLVRAPKMHQITNSHSFR